MLSFSLRFLRFLRLVALVTPLVLLSFYIVNTNNRSPFQSSFLCSFESNKFQHGDIKPTPHKNSTLKEPGAQSSSNTTIPFAIDNSAILGIPDKIWQTAKLNTLTEDQRHWSNTWTTKNPSFRLEVLTDRSSETFVRTHYLKTRPDIVEVYEALAIPIMRADLLRYLMLLAEGGLWSDLDATCEKQVSEWVPPEYKSQDIDIIVGLEFDFEWRGPGTPVASQFSNWIFAARPASRNLKVVVDAVVEMIKSIASSNGVSVAELTLDMFSLDVVDVTGPKIMTIQILKSLGQLLGRTVDDRDFSGIKHPKLIGDVLIMPGNSFAAIQNGFPDDQGDVLVIHHYEGSWKQVNAEAKERKQKMYPHG